MGSGERFLINKGINKPIEFRGLKAQYIGRLAVVVIGVMGLFAVLYATVDLYLAVAFALGLGGWVISRIYRMSAKYGQFGLMKRKARKQIPRALLSRSRAVFKNLSL